MRKVLPLSVCALVFNVVVTASLYVPDAPYTQAVFWLPFIPAFLTFGSAMWAVNGRRLGRIGWDRIWDLIVVLPRWVKASLALLFAATTVSTLTSQSGTQTDVGFERNFAVIGVWLTAVGAALHYALRKGPEPGTGRHSYRIALAVFIIAGFALAATTFLLSRHPVFDEKTTHDRLATQFGNAPWYPHLVAANTYHGAFVVYLDTSDRTVQTGACTDLKPVAAQLGRVPDLYYLTSGHNRFAMSC